MNQPDSPEFLAILERVPRWHMLTPGVDVYKKGDEWLTGDIEWGDVNPQRYDEFLSACFEPIVRRPIPENVRRSEAWWALYNQLATVAPRMENEGYGYETGYSPSEKLHIYIDPKLDGHPGPDLIRTHNLFETREAARAAIPILGGEAEIIKNFQEGPGAYMRWVLEKNRP